MSETNFELVNKGFFWLLLLIPLLYLLNAVFGLNGAVLGQSITDYITIALSCVVWRRIRHGLEQRT